jgi:hypothetical protein
MVTDQTPTLFGDRSITFREAVDDGPPTALVSPGRSATPGALVVTSWIARTGISFRYTLAEEPSIGFPHEATFAVDDEESPALALNLTLAGMWPETSTVGVVSAGLDAWTWSPVVRSTPLDATIVAMVFHARCAGEVEARDVMDASEFRYGSVGALAWGAGILTDLYPASCRRVPELVELHRRLATMCASWATGRLEEVR